MKKDFRQIEWNAAVEQDLERLLRLAVREDAGELGDLTTLALVPPEATGAARVVKRQAGVVAGLPAIPTILASVGSDMEWEPVCNDATSVGPGTVLGRIRGAVRQMLVAERLVLNVLGRLSGIATLTQTYVQRMAGTRARLYDTRKTTPGWRLLEKYAVRCGGGFNHRSGLDAAILIKDNHLAFVRSAAGTSGSCPRDAVLCCKNFLRERAIEALVEVEVDSLDQLRDVLSAAPDLVLLDNMSTAQIREAVQIRDRAGVSTELEASGGITLDTLRAIAETGVERISVGALTHAATSCDIGLDWEEEAGR